MARKEKTIHYLYKTTCNVNGRYYVGMHSTNNLEDGYMGSGRRLRASMRKYGIENFNKEILEFFETREMLVEAEIKAITPEMITDKNCMNLMGGGTGGFISDEQQRHRSICAGKAFADKLKNDMDFSKYHSTRSSELLKSIHKKGKIKYNTFEGKGHSEETKQLMSEIKKGTGVGETNSQFGTCWITKDGTNKKIKKEDLETYLNESWVKGRK
jgi:NUMOD3 motif